MDFQEYLRAEPVLGVVAKAAAALHTPAYLIGGSVRDLLLERPSKDLDIVCTGSGIALAEAVAARLPGASLAVFQNFGTAQVKTHGLELEFVGARRESYRHDSRKPAVEDGTLADDQLRRDFTINAMALSLNAADFGQLLDPFDGQGDLRRRLIRTPLPPEATFSDDPLRMLRAVRFATRLGFDIDPDTFEGMARTAARIGIVSQERITDELNKILLAERPSYGFKLLDIAGILPLIFPEFMELRGVEHVEGKGHKDNFYHTLQVLDNVAALTPDLWVRWAAVLHDIAKPATKRFEPKRGWTFHGHEELGARMVPAIFRKFRLPLDDKMRKVRRLVRLHLRPIALAKEGITDAALRRLMVEAGDDLNDLMRLCRADITSKDGNKVRRYLGNFDRLEQLMYEVEERDQLRTFQPVITGELIMQLFDLPPSKEVGLLKNTVREAILEGTVPNTLEAALPFLVQEAARMGFKPV